eukprot:4358594-Prymnesium_polylepis.1
MQLRRAVALGALHAACACQHRGAALLDGRVHVGEKLGRRGIVAALEQVLQPERAVIRLLVERGAHPLHHHRERGGDRERGLPILAVRHLNALIQQPGTDNLGPAAVQVAANEHKMRMVHDRSERLVLLLRRLLDQPVLQQRSGVHEEVFAQRGQAWCGLVKMGFRHVEVCRALTHAEARVLALHVECLEHREHRRLHRRRQAHEEEQQRDVRRRRGHDGAREALDAQAQCGAEHHRRPKAQLPCHEPVRRAEPHITLGAHTVLAEGLALQRHREAAAGIVAGVTEGLWLPEQLRQHEAYVLVQQAARHLVDKEVEHEGCHQHHTSQCVL